METEHNREAEAHLESLKTEYFEGLRRSLAAAEEFMNMPPEGGSRTEESIQAQLQNLNKKHQEAEAAFNAGRADQDAETTEMLAQTWKELQNEYGLVSEKLMAGAGWQ